MCYLSKLLNTSHFVPLFLAHEDVVVGIAIFHIKLSTDGTVMMVPENLLACS
jgi:hypothetical protein